MEPKPALDELSCQQIFALLCEYLDAELPAELCQTLSGHIEGCAPCVAFVNSLRQSVELCRKFEPETLPPPIAEEVRTKLRRAYEHL
jgi:hypothetical protein